MEATSIKTFYQEILGDSCERLNRFLDDESSRDIGHFNVFDIAK